VPDAGRVKRCGASLHLLGAEARVPDVVGQGGDGSISKERSTSRSTSPSASQTATRWRPPWTGLVEGQVADQAKAHHMSEEQVPEQVILAPHATKRLIEPAQVAATVALLLSPDGAAFTGAPVIMDQGWTAR
jgi:hypothetical protein